MAALMQNRFNVGFIDVGVLLSNVDELVALPVSPLQWEQAMQAVLLYEQRQPIISAGRSQQASGGRPTGQSMADWCVTGSAQTRRLSRQAAGQRHAPSYRFPAIMSKSVKTTPPPTSSGE